MDISKNAQTMGWGRGGCSMISCETGVRWIGTGHNWKKWVGEGMGPEK